MNVAFARSELAAPPVGAGPLAPSFERMRLRAYLALIVGDILALLAGFTLAGLIYTGVLFEQLAMMAAQLLLPLFLTIALFNRTYSIIALVNQRKSIANMGLALIVSAGLLNFIAFYTKTNAEFSRATFTIGLILSALLMIALRVGLMNWLRERVGPSIENVLVIEDGGPPVALPHAFQLDAAACGLSPSVDDPHALDRLGNYLRNMDCVIVTCPRERRGAWAFLLKCMGVDGHVLSETAHDFGALGVRHFEDAAVSTLVVSTGPLGLRSRAAKRLFDLAVSLAAIVLLAPLLIGAALAVRFHDGGPALFAQRRLGRANRFFTIYKFRSMAVAKGDADGFRHASKDDDRVTRIGRFLRRSSIDELPQLFNVLKGDMSIVGPRPHPLGCHAGDRLFWEIDPQYWQRHSLKPGLTGLAQVRGFRGATDHEQDLTGRLQSDLEYLHGWSLWRDFIILIGTLRVLVHDRAF